MKCLSLKSSRTRVANNERGQVGIFVALIFQVIFVFFAMLINVGLVVHHKINLQQSTDLAAYYGAMKQAEILNAMSHVNFQMRQAWKLLTWRYRILGTFGYVNSDGAGPIEYSMKIGPLQVPQYNPASENFKCSGAAYPKAANLTMGDVPFMCVGHAGFADWKSPDNSSESQCRATCSELDGAQSSISPIPTVGTKAILSANYGSGVKAAIDTVNATMTTNCNELAPRAMALLSSFYRSYFVETQNRRDFIKMLNRDLLLSENDILDLDGKKIITGAKNTFENNLTEANKSGLIKFETLNGTKGLSEKNLISEINFNYIQFYIHRCVTAGTNTTSPKSYFLSSIYNNGTLRQELADQADKIPNLKQMVLDVFNNNNEDFNTIGFEKNPWYQVYYGVKATAEPKIPFLPIAKIKLSAISFAKPFGGSIGPWYMNNWGADSKSSFESDNDYNHRTDKNLPRLQVMNDPSLQTLVGSRDTFLNYSNYVGDGYSNEKGDGLKGGLANNQIIAFYHAMLMNKFVPNENIAASKNKISESVNKRVFKKPVDWPKLSEWSHLIKDINEPEYDPLALNNDNPTNPKNTLMRDLEISAIAPNQFDLTYYSIDPNFYQTYYTEKLGKDNAFQNLQTATGITVKAFPTDFGFNAKLANDGSIPRIDKEPYSIRHQLQVVNEIFKKKMTEILGVNTGVTIQDKDGSGRSYFFTYIPKFQSSLLTGWTFNDFKDFTTFPSPSNDKSKYTMQFGTCADPWMKDNGGNPAYDSPNTDESGKPTVPGNCVTGGRTGYSVKIISNEMVRSGRQIKDAGGPGKSGEIQNPVPSSFITF